MEILVWQSRLDPGKSFTGTDMSEYIRTAFNMFFTLLKIFYSVSVQHSNLHAHGFFCLYYSEFYRRSHHPNLRVKYNDTSIGARRPARRTLPPSLHRWNKERSIKRSKSSSSWTTHDLHQALQEVYRNTNTALVNLATQTMR